MSSYQKIVAVAAAVEFFRNKRVYMRLNFIINDTATFRYDNKIKWRERVRERKSKRVGLHRTAADINENRLRICFR